MTDKETPVELNFSIVDPVPPTIPLPIEKKGFGAAKYVYYGEDNRYPDFLLACYDECATLQAIINRIADYISGSGFNVEQQEKLVVNHDGLTLLELVKKVSVDYLIFGAFTLGVRRNYNKEISDLDYHDPRLVRLSEDGTTAYVCRDWRTSGNKTEKYPVYKPGYVDDSHTIFYYKSPKSRGVYGRPIWAAVTKDVQTAIEISTFHLSAIRNNFNGSAVVNFNNGVPAMETQKDIEKRVNKKFAGASNAGRIVVCFNNSKDNQTTIGALPQNNFDQKYQALAEHTKNNIFIAFSAQPQLFGADPERTGFNSVEYQQSFYLFKETVVKPLQSEIESAFAMLGEKYTFVLNEFNIDFGDTAAAAQEPQI